MHSSKEETMTFSNNEYQWLIDEQYTEYNTDNMLYTSVSFQIACESNYNQHTNA